jgi:hypothetical protein
MPLTKLINIHRNYFAWTKPKRLLLEDKKYHKEILVCVLSSTWSRRETKWRIFLPHSHDFFRGLCFKFKEVRILCIGFISIGVISDLGNIRNLGMRLL